MDIGLVIAVNIAVIALAGIVGAVIFSKIDAPAPIGAIWAAWITFGLSLLGWAIYAVAHFAGKWW